MKVLDYTPETLTTELINRINAIDQRERIVLKTPFGSQLNRIEIYCSETYNNPSCFGGTPFPGIVSLQQFEDYSNKPTSKSSYTYKDELLRFLPKLVNNIFELINKEKQTA